MRHHAALPTALTLLVSACATAPEKIGPSMVDAASYRTMSCQQLGGEEDRVQSLLEKRSASQTRTRSIDTIGVAVLGVPAGSVLGGSYTKQIGRLKGQQLAIWRQETQSDCGRNALGEAEVARASDTAAPTGGAIEVK